MQLKVIESPKSDAPRAVKPPVDPATLHHRHLLEGDFWRRIPAYAGVSEEEFLDHKWQMKQTITRVDKLLAALQGLVSPAFISDAEEGFAHAPMAVRVSPYLLSLIDWEHPYEDPLRRQFIPLGSTRSSTMPRATRDTSSKSSTSRPSRRTCRSIRLRSRRS